MNTDYDSEGRMTHSYSDSYARRDFFKRAASAGLVATAGALDMKVARSAPHGETLPRFKYAMCNETFGDWPFERAFALVAECGYKGIEIAPFTMAEYVTDIPAKRRDDVRRLAKKNGLEVVGLHWLLAKTKGFHVTSADGEVRRKTVQYLGELARFCADLGGKIMVFGSPKQRDLAPGMTKEEGMKYAADVFRAAVPAFEKADVVLALEPLGPADTNFLTNAAEGVELMNLVGSPRIRLHLDCKAMATGEGKEDCIHKPFSWIPDCIRKYRDAMVHFHANDPNLQGPGFGKLDFVPIMKALRDINYRGWVSVEVFDYTPGAERLARESIACLRRCEGSEQ
jgi:sugar phosphate isomerase/epimerase